MDPHNQVVRTSDSPKSELEDQDAGAASMPAPAYSNAATPPAEEDEGAAFKAQKLKVLTNIRQACIELQSKCKFSSERELLDQLSMKAESYRMRISEADADKSVIKGIFKEFSLWTQDWQGGEPAMDLLTDLKSAEKAKQAREAEILAREEEELRLAREEQASAAAAQRVEFSDECEAVFEDMQRQFRAWDGSSARRGAWWGAARPGSKSGATSIPSSVFAELIDKLKKSTWRFEGSWSGGESFHRTRSGVDFIYHRHPPQEEM